MNLFWVGSEGIYIFNFGSKVITSKKCIYNFYLLVILLIVGLMNSVL